MCQVKEPTISTTCVVIYRLKVAKEIEFLVVEPTAYLKTVSPRKVRAFLDNTIRAVSNQIYLKLIKSRRMREN
jgi:hypothetical protein